MSRNRTMTKPITKLLSNELFIFGNKQKYMHGGVEAEMTLNVENIVLPPNW